MGVAAGTIEREIVLLPPRPPLSEYREGDYERDHQPALPQGRKAAGECKPRQGLGDRKRERSFRGLIKAVTNKHKVTAMSIVRRHLISPADAFRSPIPRIITISGSLCIGFVLFFGGVAASSFFFFYFWGGRRLSSTSPN